ncbi:hypothetical protein D3C72_1391450 [compost metagenome]
MDRCTNAESLIRRKDHPEFTINPHTCGLQVFSEREAVKSVTGNTGSISLHEIGDALKAV